MMKQPLPTGSEISFTRMDSMLSSIRILEGLGIPCGRYAQLAGIPLHLMDQPDALVPVSLTGKFAQILSRAEGVADIGMNMGLQHNAMEDFGNYSTLVRRSPTCLIYLNRGAALIGKTITGVSVWVSSDRGGSRFNLIHPGLKEGWGVEPAMFLIGATIATLRTISNQEWSPKSLKMPPYVSLQASTRNLLGGIRTVPSSGVISFPIDFKILSKTVLLTGSPEPIEYSGTALPASFEDGVAKAVDFLLKDNSCSLENTSEALGFSRRTFQRKLNDLGTSFSEILRIQRFRLAKDLLNADDMSIAEIAFELGFSDASNFTREFRLLAGRAPSQFLVSEMNARG